MFNYYINYTLDYIIFTFSLQLSLLFIALRDIEPLAVLIAIFISQNSRHFHSLTLAIKYTE